MSDNEQKYERERVMERVKYSSERMKEVISRYYNQEETDRIINKSLEEVEKFIPILPYLGEKENMFVGDFFDSLLHLGLYNVLVKEGSTARDVGKFVYEIMELRYSRYYSNMSKLKKFLFTRKLFSASNRERFNGMIDAMNEKNYPNNWIMEYVDGDKKTFNWGIDVHQCAIHKFYLENGGKELAPYICLQDFAMYQENKKIGFWRTKTLAGGGDFCDFRLKKGEPTPKGWPPETLEEWIEST
ncbi:MAG: L-2-amino-thiazoline-4-carboxylic acid hydrolase [Asgard group archaeon]|nr:L-2-amino-thiazoline-4-carboxylic acid hydrolase [Asgard group archaeon]